MKTIGIFGWKGGVGKSTTAVALAKLTAERGMRRQDWIAACNPGANDRDWEDLIYDLRLQRRGNLYTAPALLLPLDPQRTVTTFFGISTGPDLPDKPLPARGTILAVLNREQSILDVAVQVSDQLWVVPEHPGTRTWTYNEEGLLVLRHALQQPAVQRTFTRCYVDSPPSMPPACMAGIAACDLLVTPLRPDMFDLLTVQEQRQTLLHLQREQGMPDLIVAGLFASAYDAYRDADALAEGFGDRCPLPVLRTEQGDVFAVHYCKSIKDAHKAGDSVVITAPTSRAAKEFRQLWRMLECQLNEI